MDKSNTSIEIKQNMFWSKRVKVTGEYSKLHNDEFHNYARHTDNFTEEVNKNELYRIVEFINRDKLNKTLLCCCGGNIKLSLRFSTMPQRCYMGQRGETAQILGPDTRWIPNSAVWWLPVLHQIQKVPNWNLIWETRYPNQNFAYISLVIPS
jgi:hypothetical protein